MASLKKFFKTDIPVSMKITGTDRVKEVLTDLLFLLVLFLFFRSVYILLILPICVVFYHQYYKKELLRKYKERINSEFKDALAAIASSLRAGLSAENALSESYREMQVVYGADAPITRELQIMVNQITLGIPMENIFDEFAQRTKVDDIETFSSVFKIAKRTGGDMVEIIHRTAEDIAAKIDTKNEIQVLISSKKLEQNIMSLMPLLIILYIELTSGGMLAPLYGNLKGVVIMSICLISYVFAYFLSRKIMDIEV